MPPSKLRELYTVLVQDVRTMFQVCRLVHADLSEYNILYHQGRLAIIDVSQSVDLDHPRCFDFLKEDLLHVNDFFRRNGARRRARVCAAAVLTRPAPRAGVATATERELFDFVTDPAIGAHNIEACLDRLIAVADARAASGVEYVFAC